MSHTVLVLPEAQLAPLLRAYDAAVAAKRRQLAIGLFLAAVALALSVIGAEVDPAKFWENIGNFTSYSSRLSHLDSGDHVWTDPAEWFWGLKRWSLLLGETIMPGFPR